MLAWHHAHVSYSSPAKPKHSHQHERECWLACAAGRLGDEFDTLKTLVFDTLDTIVRASSLVEMVNGLLRPSLNSCKGQITQEAVNLLMFSHNHHRYTSGKRQGQAPMELFTGKPLEAEWWELLRQQVNNHQHVTDPGVLPPLQLMVNNDGRREPLVMAPCQVRVEHTDTSEQECQQTVPQAA